MASSCQYLIRFWCQNISYNSWKRYSIVDATIYNTKQVGCDVFPRLRNKKKLEALQYCFSFTEMHFHFDRKGFPIRHSKWNRALILIQHHSNFKIDGAGNVSCESYGDKFRVLSSHHFRDAITPDGNGRATEGVRIFGSWKVLRDVILYEYLPYVDALRFTFL